MTPLQITLFVALCLALALMGYWRGLETGTKMERRRIIAALDGVIVPARRLVRTWLERMVEP